MDAVKIYEEAARRVGRGEINLMEFWKLIRPLRDVEAVVRGRDCKHNPLETWFDCPLAHLKYDGERWCWKGERKDGDGNE